VVTDVLDQLDEQGLKFILNCGRDIELAEEHFHLHVLLYRLRRKLDECLIPSRLQMRIEDRLLNPRVRLELALDLLEYRNVLTRGRLLDFTKKSLNGLVIGQGELEVAGLRVGKDTLKQLRASVGVVFQDPDDQLFMPTVREDVAFGPLNMGLQRSEVSDRVEQALAKVRMTHVVDRPPYQLSMGERRRVAIATVLAMDPSLLVLDEPSANLDPRARRELLEVLETIDRTMIVTTHDLPLAAELCERAVILAAGRIVADGACDDVLADTQLLMAHDLELPAGFDLRAIQRRPRPRPARVHQHA